MAIRHGIAASAVALKPTVTISAATNFNQSIATLNASVSANGYSTNVVFQYDTSSSFNSINFMEVNASTTPITGQSVTLYANITGLSAGTTYYFRCVAGNTVGNTESSSLSFTTWALQVYERTSTGGTTFTIPTVTPTGGSAVTVSIYDIIMFGGGGGGTDNGGGGGGGGYVSQASATLSGNRSITTSVGGGGAANHSSGNGASGASSTISGDLTTLTAGGGGGGIYSVRSRTGGNSGNGYIGGNTVWYDYDPNDKYGFNNDAHGGGAGASANGGNGVANSGGTYGGNGGNGVSITRGGVTRDGGGGGGGTTQIFDGGPFGDGANGAYRSYGAGGRSYYSGGYFSDNGGTGMIRFRYYAASALA